jgi:hypothetical protein
MDEYNVKLNKYYTYSENNMFILEVEKLCGYSEFVFVYKNCTLSDVCKSIFQHFECSHKENKKVFVTKRNQSSEVCNDNTSHMDIQEDWLSLMHSDELFRNFVNNNSDYFRPIYDLPCRVVYKIYLDDGHFMNNNV